MLTKALILFGLLALAQGYSFTSREVKCHGKENPHITVRQQQAAVHLLAGPGSPDNWGSINYSVQGRGYGTGGGHCQGGPPQDGRCQWIPAGRTGKFDQQESSPSEIWNVPYRTDGEDL